MLSVVSLETGRREKPGREEKQVCKDEFTFVIHITLMFYVFTTL